jgi:hypothetical protein
LDKNSFSTQFGSTIQVDGIHCLIRTERYDLSDTTINGRIDNVLGAKNVRPNSFKRVVFTGGNLFHRSCMNDDVHTLYRSPDPFWVSNISNKIPNTRIGQMLTHLMLLQLITAKNPKCLKFKLFG